MYDEHGTAVGAADPDPCELCAALVLPAGRQRHQAWHDLVDAGLVGLTADVAALRLGDQPSTGTA